MRSPSIVVVKVLTDCLLKVLVAEYQPVIQAFAADAAYPAFRDRIGLWRFHWCTDLLDAQRMDASIKSCTETAVTVMDQESRRFR